MKDEEETPQKKRTATEAEIEDIDLDSILEIKPEVILGKKNKSGTFCYNNP